MRTAYPIIITENKGMHIVTIPDFDINTEGENMADAMYMARDAIGMIGISMLDDNEALPLPTALGDVIEAKETDIVTLVDIDFDEYRRKHDNRVVKKNCTLPSWLNELAIENNINFSQVLQEGIRSKLGLVGQ